MNEKQAQALYENGKINKTEMKQSIKEKTLSKRIIHRHLDFLVEERMIEHFGYKYRIIDKVKRDIRYWSHEFGVSILDELMRCYFPRVLKFEENIEQLINIFGIYIIYCLAKAAHPPVSKGDSHKNNLDRDLLVVSWVNEVFNPQRMLDYFVAIMTSLPPDDKVESIRNNTFVKKYPKYPSWLDKIKKVNSPRSPKHITWKNEYGHVFSPEDACVIRTKRFWTLLYSKAKSNVMTRESNFALKVDTTQRITEVLKKKYHNYYEGIVRNSQSGDIVEIISKRRKEMESWLSLATEESFDSFNMI